MFTHRPAQRLSALAAAVALIAAPAANADIVTITGNTTGKPVFDRPLENLSGPSAFGAAVRYDTFIFRAGTSGVYSFLTTGMYDTFVLLYAGTFNPNAPVVNALVANDDLLPTPLTTSGFARTLTAGATYTYVTTGFDAAAFGAYSTTIGGPGTITAVPEAQSWALFAAGLGLMGAAVQRRRQPAA